MAERCVVTDRQKVLLFRVPKESEDDPYEKELLDNNYVAYSIPVLQFHFTNLEELLDILQTDICTFCAIVFSSSRAVEATLKALSLLKNEDITSRDVKRSCFELRCFVVGPGTFIAAKTAGFSHVEIGPGNAKKLSDFIIENVAIKAKPILYPCGNLRRDTLSTNLKEAGYLLKEIQVYETIPSETIKSDVEIMMTKIGLPDYIVYFSPSGVQFTSDMLNSGIIPTSNVKVVAIGPTTEKELKSRGLSVHGVASSPDPRGVVMIIHEGIRRMQTEPNFSMAYSTQGLRGQHNAEKLNILVEFVLKFTDFQK